MWVMTRGRHGRQIHKIKISNKSFERVDRFKYLGLTLTNQNSISEELRRRSKTGNACYHSVQNLDFQFAIQKYKTEDTQKTNFALFLGGGGFHTERNMG